MPSWQRVPLTTDPVMLGQLRFVVTRLTVPLSDLKCRTAEPRERAYKLFDGGDISQAPGG